MYIHVLKQNIQGRDIYQVKRTHDQHLLLYTETLAQAYMWELSPALWCFLVLAFINSAVNTSSYMYMHLLCLYSFYVLLQWMLKVSECWQPTLWTGQSFITNFGDELTLNSEDGICTYSSSLVFKSAKVLRRSMWSSIAEKHTNICTSHILLG